MGIFVSPSDPSLDDLILAAQADTSDDSVAMADILRHFANSIAATANSVTSDCHLRQDAAQGARLGLVKAVRNHTVGTDGFVTYARRYMRTEAIRTCKAMSPKAIVQDSSAVERVQHPGARRGGATITEPLAFTIQSVSTVLSATQRTILTERYVYDRGLSDIARDLGVSVPAISQRLKTIHKMLLPALAEAVAA